MSFFFSRGILDSGWAGHAFMVPESNLKSKSILRRRGYTTSSRKFIDTTLGGHFAVNPHSQFTANCDLPHTSIYSASMGVGRWWSEVLDDNALFWHVRVGVPKYNTMVSFLSNFYNVEAGVVARTGRGGDIWFKLGQAAGFIGTLPLQPFIIGGTIIKFFLGMPRSKFYYLKPTMYTYWKAVGSLCNTYLVNSGMTSYFTNENNKEFFDPATAAGDAERRAQARIFDGTVIMRNGAFDVFAASTKAQRLANLYRTALDKELDTMVENWPTDGGSKSADEKRAEALEKLVFEGVDKVLTQLPHRDTIKTYVGREVTAENPATSCDMLVDYEHAYINNESQGKIDENAQINQAEPLEEQQDEGFWSKFAGAWTAERKMGADFVTFMVNNTGTHSESFSNTFGESGLQETMNSTSASARSARFNVADGNLGIPGVDAAIGAFKSAAAGALDSMQAGGLMALSGNAFADIQKMYQSSSSDLMTTSFNIPLRAWTSDKWILFKRIYYPLFCLMALALPRSTGNSSYDQPPLLESFLRGRSQIREGCVSSMNITRGVGDVGFTKDGHALGIDVSITVEDMSGVFGIPIQPDTSKIMAAIGTLGDVAESVAAAFSKSTYSEDNRLGDYQYVLAAVSLENQINTFKKWKLALARTRANMQSWRSPHRMVSGMMDTLPGDLIKALSAPTDRN